MALMPLALMNKDLSGLKWALSADVSVVLTELTEAEELFTISSFKSFGGERFECSASMI